MGGTIARLVDHGHEVQVAVLTGHGDTPSYMEIRFLGYCAQRMPSRFEIISLWTTHFCDLPAAFLDATPAHQINKTIKTLVADVDPQEVCALHLTGDHGATAYGA